ncbi:DUF4386 domain-containing protein [Sinimarinibacterium sp. CAU 1509]|nr:DUF4386 domain-containing protein [Sinimarinibacterium sp. CAU 1509]
MVCARSAGVLYLIIIACGIAGEVFVRGGLVVEGDAAATAARILGAQGQFRIGFVLDALMLLSDVAIAVLFYVLLKPVSATLALMAAAFRLTQAAILGMNLLNYYAALLVLGGTVEAAALGSDQQQALASLFLDLHRHGYDLGLLFFGCSSMILGSLVVRSPRFPALLGYGLIAAGVVYLAGSFIRFAWPEFATSFEPVYGVSLVAELSFCLWLLFRGVRNVPSGEPSARAVRA